MRLGLGATLSKKALKKPGSLFSNNKSLNFDGTDDYVELGASNTLMTGTNQTISAWFKNSSGGMAYIFQNRRGAGSSNLSLGINFNAGVGVDAGYVGFVMYNGSGHTVTVTDENIDNGAWHHLAVTISDGAQKLYLDGSEVASSTAAFDNEASADTSIIGSNGGSDRFMNGNIDEVALWNTVLDADAITAIYNSGTPTNLSSNSGDYDNSSNLQGYWRMGDGTLDEYPSIADQTNATLGSDLWDAGVYDTGTGSWSVYGNNTIENDNGALKITHVGGSGAGAGAYVVFRDSNDLSTNLTAGKIYKLSWEAKVNSGSEVGMHIWSGSASTYPSTETNTEFTPNTHYFLCKSAAGAWMRQTGLGSGEILWIKNLSIQEVQGNPGHMTSMTSGDIEEDTP